MLIVAASARPWIRSAEIAGFDVIAFDFFSDWDSILRGPECVRSFRGGAEVGERRAVGRLKRFEDLLLKSNLDMKIEFGRSEILLLKLRSPQKDVVSLLHLTNVKHNL